MFCVRMSCWMAAWWFGCLWYRPSPRDFKRKGGRQRASLCLHLCGRKIKEREKVCVCSLWQFSVCHTVIVIKSMCCQYFLAESLALRYSMNLFPSASRGSNTGTYRTFGEQRLNACPLSFQGFVLPYFHNPGGLRTLQMSQMYDKKWKTIQ